MRTWLPLLVMLLIAPTTRAERAVADLRHAHERCVRGLLRLEREDGGVGSGWLTRVAGRIVVVTNAHVVDGVTRVRVVPYGGDPVLAGVAYRSSTLDLALLLPGPLMTRIGEAELPVTPLVVSSRPLVRGERVVLGGNPGGLGFITTEGVVAGVISNTHDADVACGVGRNCVVLDGEGEPGSSGGPIVDASGEVIGMLWGVFRGSSLSIAIHAHPLQTELDRAASRLTRTSLRVAPQPTLEP